MRVFLQSPQLFRVQSSVVILDICIYIYIVCVCVGCREVVAVMENQMERTMKKAGNRDYVGGLEGTIPPVVRGLAQVLPEVPAPKSLLLWPQLICALGWNLMVRLLLWSVYCSHLH